MGLEGENTTVFERQNTIGKPMNSALNLEENDMIHEKLMELEPLLEASGERNLRNIDISHGECPCHCLAQTVRYPEHSNLCLVWEVEEIRSIGLPDHRQKVTRQKEIVGVAMDRGERDEISVVKVTDSGIDICYRLQQET